MPKTISKTQRRILAYLETHPNASLQDIAAEFGFRSKNAARWHVKWLSSAGALEEPTVTRTAWRVISGGI